MESIFGKSPEVVQHGYPIELVNAVERVDMPSQVLAVCVESIAQAEGKMMRLKMLVLIQKIDEGRALVGIIWVFTEAGVQINIIEVGDYGHVTAVVFVEGDSHLYISRKF